MTTIQRLNLHCYETEKEDAFCLSLGEKRKTIVVKYASRGIKQNDVSRKPFIHRKDQDERDEVFL